MKKEKPNPKRPQLWHQHGLQAFWNIAPIKCGPRLRIFYPNGGAEWLLLGQSGSYSKWSRPCWMWHALAKTNAHQAAREFDREIFFKPMEFVSNL